jgi:hypothetical protein
VSASQWAKLKNLGHAGHEEDKRQDFAREENCPAAGWVVFHGEMRSVPPRGSGWVYRLPIVNWRFAIGDKANWQSGIRKSEEPTRYRVVVLTSSHPVNGNAK